MKVLVVGGGGREHALVWKLARDSTVEAVHAAPGNPGTASLATNHPVAASDTKGLIALADVLEPDLVVVGPEAPLAGGLGDALRANGRAVFGPNAAAARIESSKSFAKDLMRRYGIPTAAAKVENNPVDARRAARHFGAPVVIKASGLAAGKGVFVCPTLEDADEAIDLILLEKTFGSAGSEILVEEFMQGEELSVFAICDGKNFVLLPSSQDHKRLLEGDLGPNTGGMGAFAPVSLATEPLMARIGSTIIAPTLAAMQEEGCPFSGLLYAGLMITADGPRVVEFNCRFGDPETQVVLPLLKDDLAPLLQAAAAPDGLSGADAPRTTGAFALTTVLASQGYPEAPTVGSVVTLPEQNSEHTIIFHAGTRMNGDALLETSGGRVFAVTGVGPTLLVAQQRSQDVARRITFDGKQWRTDIGWRELASGASGASTARGTE